MSDRPIQEVIQQRIYQILVHSCIYYDYDMNIVPDHQYDSWGKELQKLVKEYPEIVAKCIFGDQFKNYSETSSGFDLNYRHPLIRERAEYLLKLRRLI